jgi:hypothetical protein
MVKKKEDKEREDDDAAAEGGAEWKTRAVPFPADLLAEIAESARVDDRTVVSQVRVLCRAGLAARSAVAPVKSGARRST